MHCSRDNKSWERCVFLITLQVNCVGKHKRYVAGSHTTGNASKSVMMHDLLCLYLKFELKITQKRNMLMMYVCRV